MNNYKNDYVYIIGMYIMYIIGMWPSFKNKYKP